LWGEKPRPAAIRISAFQPIINSIENETPNPRQLTDLVNSLVDRHEAFLAPLVKKVMSAEITSTQLVDILKEIAVRTLWRPTKVIDPDDLTTLGQYKLALSKLSYNNPTIRQSIADVWALLLLVLRMRKKGSFLYSHGGGGNSFIAAVTRTVKKLSPLTPNIQHKIQQYESTRAEIRSLVAAKRAAWSKRPGRPRKPRPIFRPRRRAFKPFPFSVLAKSRRIEKSYKRLSAAQLIYLKTAGINLASSAAFNKKKFSKFWPSFNSYAKREKIRTALGPFDNDDSSYDIESSEWSDIVEDEARGRGENIGASSVAALKRSFNKESKKLKEQRSPLFLFFPKTVKDVIRGSKIKDF
jgi:hypothetical protein